MGQGLKAYKMAMGRHARMEDLVDIFSEGPDVVPASVAAQEQVLARLARVTAHVDASSAMGRYRGDPAASPAMSAVTPRAEVNSERWRATLQAVARLICNHSLARALSSAMRRSARRRRRQSSRFDVLHHDHIGVDVGLVVGVEVSAVSSYNTVAVSATNGG